MTPEELPDDPPPQAVNNIMAAQGIPTRNNIEVLDALIDIFARPPPLVVGAIHR